MTEEVPTKCDVIVLGAGISGLVTAKCLREAGLSVIVLERTGEVGGLWKFRENDYGVMRFTHINVSKYNYCFSDFPFPDDAPDYPHNADMASYIVDYVNHFKISELIKFNRKIISVKKTETGWEVKAKQVEEDGKTVIDSMDAEVYQAKSVAVATGHHAKPTYAKFPGQDSFKGEIIHSVDFNDVITNGMTGKRVLVVGIGNSAVDAAVNCCEQGRCKSVYISTRSGAWIIPNYIFGYATDLYACRMFFQLPWRVGNFILENVIKIVCGNPRKWKLNPKMRALQTQPTVSPTLIHHIQRREIKIVPNIQRIEGSRVYFMDGVSEEFDHIILCTGYKIDLPFLDESITKKILDESRNEIKLYKNVFSPEIGASMAFIGFVQPASGGILTMSETQARWFAQLCKQKLRLPTKSEMEDNIQAELTSSRERYYQSARHTIQKDPIIYNDDIAAQFGAKPVWWKHPELAWRLLLGSCGAYQWRLQGPNTWSGAKEAVKKVPVTDLWRYSGIMAIVALAVLIYYLYSCLF